MMQHKIFGLISLIFLTSCNFIKPVEIEGIEKISITQISFTHIDIEVVIPVTNPNFFKFTITGVDLEIAINEINVGRITELQNLPIEAHQSQTISLPLRIQLKDALSGALNLLIGFSNANTKIDLKGEIIIETWFWRKSIPINQQTNITTPELQGI